MRNIQNLSVYLLTCLVLASMPPALAEGSTLLDLLRYGDRDTAIDLLQNKTADVNLAEKDGSTALHLAVQRNDQEFVQLLLQSGADANPANVYGVTPLTLACTNQNSTIVQKLLKSGANPNSALWTGETALMTCSRTGALGGVAALLQNGADVNVREGKRGQNALMWAAANGRSEIVHVLIENGADIKSHSNAGFTPLLFAARSGDVETARILVEAGADPDESTPEFGNSLLIASAGGHEALAMFLLQAGANPNTSDQNGITPLHQAVRSGFSALNGVRYDRVYRVRPDNMTNLTEALLKAGADPNQRITKSYRLGRDDSPFNMVGATPFFLAALSADVTLLQLLEEYEADPRITTANGTTPLMAAARAGAACIGSCAFQGDNKSSEEQINMALQAVMAVVEMGVDLDATDEDGQTAMHLAAFTGADMVVQYLADHGASINVRNNYGETPWSMASGISPEIRNAGLYGRHETTAALLETLGAARITREQMGPQAPPPPGQ